MQIYTKDEINQLILKKQHLTEDSKSDNIIEIVDDLCGLHATGTLEPYIQLFIRMTQFNKDALDNELYKKQTLGRILGMRKTLFILTKYLMPIVYNATKDLWMKNIPKYLDSINITKSDYDDIIKKFLKLLENKEMTTKEIQKELNSQERISEIIRIMCDECYLIRGKSIKGWKDRRLYYARFQDYFPKLNMDMYSEQDSINLLVEKYISAYGPVTIDDITWWSGISKKKISLAIINLDNEIESIKISQLPFEFLISKLDKDKLKESDKNEDLTINLLPLLDPYIMGYKNRERYITSKY